MRAAGVDAPEAEARWIVEHASGYGTAELARAGHELASPYAVAHVDAMVDRRAGGEPLQYVLGRWDFLGLDLLVDRRALIPRPETEVVAREAIDELVRQGLRRGRADPMGSRPPECVVADLGTGCGALALALASELPDVEVWASDVSEDALAVARANLAGIGSAATRVRLASGSWFDALPHDLRGRLRLVVSNPPYIADAEVPSLPREVVDYEPRLALVSGATGMEAIAVVVGEAPVWLEPAGVLVCELAPHQAGATRDLATAAGFADVEVRRDLTGRERVLVAARSGLASVTMPDDLDVDAMLERFRERAAAVRERPLPPVAGAERQLFVQQAQLDFQDFAMVGDATWTFADGMLQLTIDLRAPDEER